MIKKIFILMALSAIFPLPLIAQATDTTETQIPSFTFSIETGATAFTGKFRNHLERDGAYRQSPALDMSFAVFIFDNWGFQGVFANQSVIHPQSKPIEGTIHHEIMELFFYKQFGRHSLKCYGGMGFQHTTMLLEYYSSGMIEGGVTYGWEFLNARSVIASVKYRRGILPSLLIKEKYGLTEADTIESVTISVGVMKAFY